jgi:DNA-binding response OmpR family regulator
MRILVIEDNPDILANLYGFLEPLGYVVDSARSGAAGLTQAAAHSYEAIVLDLMLPGLDGLEVCRQLRRGLCQDTPVLMLTARDTVHDKVAGFDAGTDDYLIKPFSLVELDVRLKALSRRARGQHVQSELSFANLRFNPKTCEVSRAGKPLRLTPTGYRLLAALMRAAPNVVARAQLVHEVWGDEPPESDALRTHIHSLRLAIDKPFGQPLLRTLPGIGYCLSNGEPRDHAG